MQNKDKHFGKTMVKQMTFLPTLIRFDLSLKSGLFLKNQPAVYDNGLTAL